MPRKKTQRQIKPRPSRERIIEYDTPETPDDPFSPVPSTEEDPIEIKIQRARDKLGGGNVELKVSRWGLSGSEYCFTTSGDLNLDMVRAQWGPGRYTCRFFVDNECRDAMEFNLAEPLTGGPPRAVPDAAPQNMMQMFQMMIQQQAQQFQMLMQTMGASKQSSTSVGELAEAIKAVHGLNGNGNGADGKLFEAMMKGLEMGREMSDGGSNKSTFQSLIEAAKDILPAFAPQLQGLSVPSLAGPAVGPRPQLVPVQNAPQGLSEVQMEQQDIQLIRQLTAYLKPLALRGKPHEYYIDTVLVNADEPQYAHFLGLVSAQEFSYFERADPEISQPQYAAWFRALYDGLRSELDKASALDADSGGESGNAGDAAGNGVPGPKVR